MIIAIEPQPDDSLSCCLTIASQLSFTLSIPVDFKWKNVNFRCYYIRSIDDKGKNQGGYAAQELNHNKTEIIRTVRQQNIDGKLSWGEWVKIA